MKNNVLNVVENVCVVFGVVISIETIYSILGVVLLIFQICIIIYKMIYAIVKHAKEKKYNEIQKDIENAKDQIESVVKDKHGNETK